MSYEVICELIDSEVNASLGPLFVMVGSQMNSSRFLIRPNNTHRFVFGNSKFYCFNYRNGRNVCVCKRKRKKETKNLSTGIM